MPKSGAGGWARIASKGRGLFWYGEIKLRNEADGGWLRTCSSKRG